MRTTILGIVLALGLQAQVNTSSITGTILDPSGAGIGKALVTLINSETGVRSTSQTTEAGIYLFVPMQPGRYRIAIEASGFKKTDRAGLELEVGEKPGVNLVLELGSINESVEVKAEAPLLTTTNANIGQVIDSRKIQELPLPGRDPPRLFLLSPAVGGGVCDRPGTPGFLAICKSRCSMRRVHCAGRYCRSWSLFA